MHEPIAKRVPHVWHRPTGDVEDSWAWLSDRDDPDTVAYLTAENQYADAWLGANEELVTGIFEEIRSRVQETDHSPAARRDGWWWLTRTEEGASYAIHCRGRSRETAGENVVLDENAEAEGHEYFAIAAFDPSHSQDLLAWSRDTDGSEHYTLKIRDLSTGLDLADEIEGTTWAGTAWSSDDRWLFYVTDDDQQRPYRVWRHLLGTAQAADEMVFEETDERFFVGVDLTRSGEWILIDSHSKTTSECRMLPASAPTGEPTIVRPRQDGVEYSVDHWGDRLVVLTNVSDLDFAVMSAPLDDPGEWSVLVAGEPGRRITAAEPFATHLVIHEWSHAQPQIRIVGRDGIDRVVDLGSEPHDVEIDVNPEYETTTLRYSFQSMTSPGSIYEHDVNTDERTLLKVTPVPGVDLSAYVAERTWAKAPDGTAVPVDMVRHTATVLPAPTVVYGYGSYEASLAPWFSVARLSLLDRGVVFAIAYPRGGGELGRQWYLDGKLLNKLNTFTDTLAGTDHLVEQGIADGHRLALRGGSAGGLLVGACVTMRPDGFAAAVAEVPFVDVVTTMSDPSLPLTVTEWEEWGDPRTEPFAGYIAGYSPYDNTNPADYPAMYITAGLNDPRVGYHEPAKWVAKLRATRTNDRPLLLRCEMGAGHGGPSGRYDAWRDEARVLAFLVVALR